MKARELSQSTLLFGQFLLCISLYELLLRFLRADIAYSSEALLVSIGMMLCGFGLVYALRQRRGHAWMLLLVSSTLLLAIDFPLTANHQYVIVFSVVLLLLLDLDRRPEIRSREQELFVTLMLYVCAAAFFWSGLQKLIHGYYFDGTFFVYSIVHSPRFSYFFSTVFGERLVEKCYALVSKTGEYAAIDWRLVLLSNMTYLFELLVPVFLLVPRTRSLAICVSVVFVCVVELAARELTFGALIVGMLLLQVSTRYFRMYVGVIVSLMLLSAGLFELRILGYLH